MNLSEKNIYSCSISHQSQSLMPKRYFVLLVSLLLATTISQAQNKVLLAIPGIYYTSQGITAKTISAKMGGQMLMSNRIPLSTEIEINLMQFAGFKADKLKLIYPAARYSLISAKGDTIQQMANLLLVNQTKGYTGKEMLKGLSMKFGIAEGLVQPNSRCIVYIELYDQKGPGKMKLEYPVSIAYPRERIFLTTKPPTALKAPAGTNAMAVGLTTQKIDIMVDTAFSSGNTKMNYLQIEITKLGGVNLINMLQGKDAFSVYDMQNNEIKIKDKMMNDTRAVFGSEVVNCTIRVPFKPKKDASKGYIVHYRWDGPDKTQALDIVAEVK